MSHLPIDYEPRPKDDPTILPGDLCIQQSTGTKFSFYFWAEPFPRYGGPVDNLAVVVAASGNHINTAFYVAKNEFLKDFRRDIPR